MADSKRHRHWDNLPDLTIGYRGRNKYIVFDGVSQPWCCRLKSCSRIRVQGASRANLSDRRVISHVESSSARVSRYYCASPECAPRSTNVTPSTCAHRTPLMLYIYMIPRICRCMVAIGRSDSRAHGDAPPTTGRSPARETILVSSADAVFSSGPGPLPAVARTAP